VGGSMDAHVAEVQRLFSALRHEVQAPGVLLFSQLPLRLRLAGQCQAP
jgi:uncharacterized protein with von Willebrand factor type A (vWA) domain